MIRVSVDDELLESCRIETAPIAMEVFSYPVPILPPFRQLVIVHQTSLADEEVAPQKFRLFLLVAIQGMPIDHSRFTVSFSRMSFFVFDLDEEELALSADSFRHDRVSCHSGKRNPFPFWITKETESILVVSTSSFPLQQLLCLLQFLIVVRFDSFSVDLDLLFYFIKTLLVLVGLGLAVLLICFLALEAFLAWLTLELTFRFGLLKRVNKRAILFWSSFGLLTSPPAKIIVEGKAATISFTFFKPAIDPLEILTPVEIII